jgi:serine/threonine protein phosphatase PrpC
MTKRSAVAEDMAVSVSAASHPGPVRSKNEDSIAVCLAPEASPAVSRALLAVADGVGGVPGGDVASRLAVESLSHDFPALERYDPAKALRRLFQRANARIHEDAASSYPGMSTTLVAAAIIRHKAWIANVGDSRAYLVRAGAARQLTRDHSLQEEARHAFWPIRKSAPPHVSNVITRSVGSCPQLKTDIYGPIDLRQGDILLLCSDGLYRVLDPADLAAASPVRETTANDLIGLANRRGTTDNVSVVAMQYAGAASRRVLPQTTRF